MKTVRSILEELWDRASLGQSKDEKDYRRKDFVDIYLADLKSLIVPEEKYTGKSLSSSSTIWDYQDAGKLRGWNECRSQVEGKFNEGG